MNNNSVLKQYVWQPVGQGTVAATYDASDDETYYYHSDANKNITEITDENGNVVAHYEYSPFGVLVKSTGSYADTNPFRFSSEYFDSETGLVYYNYRYYSPELGRWISRDPIEERGGYNLYGMLNNNTINFWDNLGLGKTIRLNFGFDKTVRATTGIIAGIQDQISSLKSVIAECCNDFNIGCDITVKAHYDYDPKKELDKYNDENYEKEKSIVKQIDSPYKGINILVTANELSGANNTLAHAASGGVVTIRTTAFGKKDGKYHYSRTLAHELGHYAGYDTSDPYVDDKGVKNPKHAKDKDNLMFPQMGVGSASPDKCYCTAIEKLTE